MEAVVFFISAAVILAGGIGVIIMRNPVHAALSLVMTLFGVAVLFVNLEAYFLAAVQVIVYAGAIVVLFLFVIMLVGVDKADDVRAEPIIGQREFAFLAGAGLVVVAILVGFVAGGEVTGQGDPGLEIVRAEEVTLDVDSDGVDETVTVAPDSNNNSNTKQLGRVLFTDYVFAFEITALLLTIAVVGAVVLARRPDGELQPIPEVEPPWPIRPEADLEPQAASEQVDPSDEAAPDENSDKGASAPVSIAGADGADEEDAEA